MLSTYFKLAFRALWRNRLFTALNTLGLAIGMGIALLMLLFIRHEFSFDRFHPLADRIFRVNLELNFNGEKEAYAAAPNAVGPTAVQKVPGVENAVRVLKNEFGADAFLRAGDVKLVEQSLYFMDPSFLQMFKVPLLQGNPSSALAEPNLAIISQSTATRYFGKVNPVGQTLTVDNQMPLQITGVFEDFPENSSLHPNIVASFSSVRWAQKLTWDNASYATYLLLAPNADPATVSRALMAEMEQNVPPENRFYTMSLMPLRDLHLHSAEFDSSYAYQLGDYADVKNYGWFALMVLLIACINYMNLATAQYQQRTREVGINKTMGATREGISLRFYVETGVLTALSIGIGLGLAALLLPAFSQLVDRKLDVMDMFSVPVLSGALLVWAVVTFFAGSYPALFLSSFSPQKMLSKSQSGGGKRDSWLRKSLVVGQFSAALVLMSGTFIMYRQMAFMRQQKLGYNPENVVAINTMGAATGKEIASLGNSCKNITGVLEVCRSQAYPGHGGSLRSIDNPTSPKEQLAIRTNRTDPGFVKTLGLTLLTGKEYTAKAPGDTVVRMVINQHLAKALGWTPEEAIGKSLPDFIAAKNEITGVVADFHYDSFHEPIGAYCFHDGDTESRVNLLVRFQSADVSATMKQLETAFNASLPTSAFDYTFLDDNLDKMYRAEQKSAKIVLYTAGLAILISCLGLFGLSAFTAERRNKEIGVRKVLGASVAGITGLLAKDFLQLVLLAILLAAPIAYYFMQEWLTDFAYRIEIQWWMFGVTALLAVVIAALTISVQSIRAALTNPVKSLRSE